jgi:hypothetical protein
LTQSLQPQGRRRQQALPAWEVEVDALEEWVRLRESAHMERMQNSRRHRGVLC